MINWPTLALLGSSSVLVSFVSTAVVRGYAIRAGVIDQPNMRSSHTIATPRGGGLAILIAASLASGGGVALGVVAWPDALVLGLGAWVLGLLGWLDDHRSLRASMRLGVQLLVAGWTLYRLGGLPVVRAGAATFHLGWPGFLLGTVGLVWSINLFNFMDGIDALAASQAALIFTAIGLLLMSTGDRSLGTIAIVLGAASMGFLPWNWPRATIFLGDVGSAPIGYLVGAIAIAAENRAEVPLPVVAIVSGVFVADATVTLVRRFLRRERLSQAHRSHAYQRLARAFHSHGVVSFGAAVETLLFALLGAAATLVPSLFVPAILTTGLVLCATLLYAERRAPMDSNSVPARVTEEMLGGERERLANR